MTDQGNIDNFRLELKRLASQNSLSLDELKEIIVFCGNFFSQDLPQKFGKSFSCPFFIQGFSGNTFKLARGNKIESQEKLIRDIAKDRELDQSQKKNIIDELKNQQRKILEENLFLSDLIAFLEQSNILLAKFLDHSHKQELAKLGNDFFSRIGLSAKTSSTQVLLKELKKLEENPSLWQKVDADLAQPMLAIISSQKEKFADKKDQEDKKDDSTAATTVQDKKKDKVSSTAKVEEEEGQESEGEKEKEKPKQTLPEDFSKEFNLARLDDLSKLYIRSLAIISINQALQIQFANLTTEQLTKMGFDDPPNFNQLPVQSRQELLTISFSKIENLLASGRYDLDKLISTPSLRISFSKDVALKVITDIRGGEIFARQLGKLTSSDLDATQVKKELEENEKIRLKEEQLLKVKIDNASLPAELKIQFKNLSSEEANNFFAQLDSNNALKNQFSQNLQFSFTRVTKNNFSQEWQKIITGDKEAHKRSFLARENITPIIDVFIQQNYPADYVESFNWQRFQAHFGREVIDQNTYVANERAIKDLLISYWKTQRAEWSRTIHQGMDNEFYTTEDLETLWQEFDQIKTDESPIKGAEAKANKKLQQKQAIYFQQIQHQARLNLVNAEAVSKKFAGFTQDNINFAGLSPEQISELNYLNSIYQQGFLDAINAGGPELQTITLIYYMPGESYALDTNTFLQIDSLPQFSAYDLGALNYNQYFDPNGDGEYPLTRSFNEEGGIDNQLGESFGAIKNKSDQALNFLGEKAVRAGLNYATGGAFESLPEPVKQMIEQMAWGAIKQQLEPLIKALVALILATFAALIALIIQIVKFIGQITKFFTGGNKEVSPVIAQKTFWQDVKDILNPATSSPNNLPIAENQLAERVTTQTQAAQQAQVAAQVQARPVSAQIGSSLSQIGQGAMATASQAVLTTFAITAGGMLIYQTILNGAFLTQFPIGGGGGGGSAVFCDDVVVGNLTYYSQKDYNNIPICGGACTFGSSACGPVAISMILNEDPIDMSIREGFLAPGGCGSTSCSGTALNPLINTLTSNGVSAVSVPTPSGSPGQITDEIGKYLSEGNLILALTHTRGFGHYYVITCVESPGYVTAYDPWWGQNVVHKVVATSGEGLMSGTDNTYIRNMYLVQN